MNLIGMHISAGLIILSAIVIRKVTISFLPHIMFWILWLIAVVRLFIPFSIMSRASIFNLYPKIKAIPHSGEVILLNKNVVEVSSHTIITPSHFDLYQHFGVILWGIGIVITAAYFIRSFYIGNKQIERSALLEHNNHYVNDAYVQKCIEEMGNFRRPISIRISEEIKTPVSYGIFKPGIIFSSQYKFTNKEELRQIVYHECAHIKYFHSLLRYLMVAVLCIFWFNPCVWLLYLYVNRDMEVTCDRSAIKLLGMEQRKPYADNIVHMLEFQSRNSIAYNGFIKSSTKERIVVVMKFKKMSVFALAFSLTIPLGMVSVFATTNYLESNDTMSNVLVVEATDSGNNVVPEAVSIEVSTEDLKGYIVEGNERINDYVKVLDYEYVSYGSIPSSLKVKYPKNGAIYSGTLYKDFHIYEDATDKYTGYYSGTLYKEK